MIKNLNGNAIIKNTKIDGSFNQCKFLFMIKETLNAK